MGKRSISEVIMKCKCGSQLVNDKVNEAVFCPRCGYYKSYDLIKKLYGLINVKKT